MKKLIRSVACLVACSAGLGALAGCGSDPLKEGKTVVTLWGFADEEEAEAAQDVVQWYNENNEDNIFIEYQPKPSGTYVTLAERALSSARAPDVFYIGDRYLKRWAKRGYLEDITSYVEGTNIDFSDMWTSSQYRWRYDPAMNTNNMDDPLYALPKDVSSTALYYNASVMERQGIKIISVDEEDIEAFNAGGEDRNGNTKASLGIDITVPAKGFYREQNYKNGTFTKPQYGLDGKVVETMIFNNRIAMSWDEIEDLAMILTRSYNDHLDVQNDTEWGYYTEWWFNYGWGVGGDCAVDTTGDGDWEFSLGDKTQKRIVYNEDGTYAVDDHGRVKFIKDGEEGALTGGQYAGNALPSQYTAFERFIKLGKPVEYGGLAVAPRQKADIGLSTSSSFFTTGQIAMLVETSEKAVSFRKAIKNFDWDIAPLPVYKEYERDNVTVKTKGLEIGHSGSTGVGIWAKSKVKAEAFKVALYLSAGHAQTMQAQNGYLIPNSITLAESEYVAKNVADGNKPKNIDLFVKAAASSRPADWWYMPDNLWIDTWATPLNTEYRENDKTVEEFFNAYTDQTNQVLRNYKQQGWV